MSGQYSGELTSYCKYHACNKKVDRQFYRASLERINEIALEMEKEMSEHELKCYENPDIKACKTCKSFHHELDYHDGGCYADYKKCLKFNKRIEDSYKTKDCWHE